MSWKVSSLKILRNRTGLQWFSRPRFHRNQQWACW
jgi:hypothetical protein